jgi:hypothetical protein
LITGILSANSKAVTLGNVLTELKVIAHKPAKLSEKDETALPQVHAMNCLKEIFKSAVLGKRCEPYVAECLEIAADSLTSEMYAFCRSFYHACLLLICNSWAIRNCGLLLIRSLIDCLFGTSESKVTAETGWDGRSIKLSYDRYPALPDLLIRLLSIEADADLVLSSTAIGAVESVFPALDIVRRAGPPPQHREKIFSIVANHLSSKVWHMRDIAARTLCTLLLHENWLGDVSNLLKSCTGSANRLHGVLLATRYVLERRLDLDPKAASGMSKFDMIFIV